MVNPVDYDGHQSTVYAKGRALRPAVMAEWMAAFAAHAPTARPPAVLDLGSGTGRFTPALADTFGGPVYGVQPSAGRRQVALDEDVAANRPPGRLSEDGDLPALELPA
jgi:cyclopropane fatty-acyl-phospholipid synthase-like methyltransferase